METEKKGLRLRHSDQWKNVVINLAPIFGLCVVVLVFAILTKGRSVSPQNVKILFNSAMLTAIVACGAVFTYSCGAIDMSLGGTICLAAICGAIVGKQTQSLALVIVTTFIVAMAISFLKGAAAAFLTLPIFIVTYIFSTLLTAIGRLMLGTETTVYLRDMIPISDSTMISVTILVAFFLLCVVIFNYTRIGKGMKLLGGNRLAATQSGINSKQLIVVAFLLNGMGAFLAAVVSILRTKTVSTATGGSISSDLMIAIVLGGMPISGGPKSKISAAVVGAATISVLNNGLSLCGVSTQDIQIIRGIVFLIVVLITSLNYRNQLLPR